MVPKRSRRPAESNRQQPSAALHRPQKEWLTRGDPGTCVIIWWNPVLAIKILFSHRYTGTLETKQTCGVGRMRRSFSVRRGMRSRMIHDPDLWLEGPPGDGYEAGQKHIINVHEAFTNPPPILYGSIEREFLGYDCEQRRS